MGTTKERFGVGHFVWNKVLKLWGQVVRFEGADEALVKYSNGEKDIDRVSDLERILNGIELGDVIIELKTGTLYTVLSLESPYFCNEMMAITASCNEAGKPYKTFEYGQVLRYVDEDTLEDFEEDSIFKPCDTKGGYIYPILPASTARTQVGGDHYAKMKIQPLDYITANNLGFCEGNIVKYISRWKDKNGIEDLRKVIDYAERLIEYERGS